MEEIIDEIRADEDFKDNKGNGKTALGATDEHNKAIEAVEDGLLQVHGMAPNMKQQGIFCIIGENCNGFNNQIGGNEKIAKALNIKEDLDINCLMYCEHFINFRYKDNKNDIKQMFQRKLACTAVWVHNIHKAKCAGRVQEGGTGPFVLGTWLDTSRKQGETMKGLAGGAGFS